jgi:hypothetical protein
MRNSGWILSFVLVVALAVIGCERQETAPATPAVPDATAPAAPDATMPDATIPPAPTTPTHTPDQAPATQPAADAANNANAQAEKLLEQAMTYIKENKLDLADKTLTQVEGMKASLSPALQTRVTEARKLLDTAKAGGGVKLPSLPGAAQ